MVCCEQEALEVLTGSGQRALNMPNTLSAVLSGQMLPELLV